MMLSPRRGTIYVTDFRTPQVWRTLRADCQRSMGRDRRTLAVGGSLRRTIGSTGIDEIDAGR